MSASRERRSRSADPTVEQKRKFLQNQQEEEKRKSALVTVLVVLGIVVAFGLTFWNQGIYQRSATAVTIGGTDYTAGQLQLFYQDQLYSALSGTIPAAEDGFPYDYATSPDEVIYSFTTGETWHDIFVQNSISSLEEIHALYTAAQNAGYVLSAEGEQTYSDTVASLNIAWIGYTNSLDSYLRMQYSPYLTEDAFLDILRKEIVASYFVQDQYDSLTHTEAEFDTHYAENPDSFDLITTSQFTFSVSVDTTKEENGEVVDIDPEVIAATLQAETDILFETLNAVEEEISQEDVDLDAVAEEYGDDVSNIALRTPVLSSGYESNSLFGEWALSPDRVEGDIFLAPSVSESSATYYLLYFHERKQADLPTSTIRHIYLGASDTIPTEEEFAATLVEAEAMLEQWKADGSSEDQFAALATEHSVDSGSAANGGMIEGISEISGYVDTFSEWALDPDRKPGDTGIVQNTGSSTQGYHIMYFVDWGDPLWKFNASTSLSNEKIEIWQEESTAAVDVTSITGPAISYITPATLY